MKLMIKRGTTSKIVRVFIQDSSVTTGAGLTGLAYNTSNLVAYFIEEGKASATAITLADATVGTWTSGGFKAVDGTNMPGLYELHLPNAALDEGNSVVVMLKGATNMAPCLLEIQLVAFDPQDSAALGLTAMPISMAQSLSASPTSGTIGEALAAARAGGIGKIVWSGTTFSVYAHDDTTVLKALTTNVAAPASGAPTTRS